MGATAGMENFTGAIAGVEKSMGATAENPMGATAGMEKSMGATAGMENSMGAIAGMEKSMGAAAGMENSKGATVSMKIQRQTKMATHHPTSTTRHLEDRETALRYSKRTKTNLKMKTWAQLNQHPLAGQRPQRDYPIPGQATARGPAAPAELPYPRAGDRSRASGPNGTTLSQGRQINIT